MGSELVGRLVLSIRVGSIHPFGWHKKASSPGEDPNRHNSRRAYNLIWNAIRTGG